MNKISKAVGVGLVGAAVVGAIAYAIKKVRDVDNFDDSLEEDEFDSDFSDNDEDVMSEEDFDDNFPTSSISDEDFVSRTGMDKSTCIQAIYDMDESYTIEELEKLSDLELIDLYDSLTNENENSELDTFKMINEATREEVIRVLLEGNKDNDDFEYDEESLNSLSDGELTQVYADYKVSIK